MPYEVRRDLRVDKDLLALPVPVRDAFWRVIRGLRRDPFAPGLGYAVDELRRTEERYRAAWTAHFLGNRYRLLYKVDGNLVVIYGVGVRPGFYRKLDRLGNSRPA